MSLLLGFALAVSLAGLVAVELMQVFLRYAFNAGFAWVAAVQTELLLCVAWFGTAKLWVERGSLSMITTTSNNKLSSPVGMCQLPGYNRRIKVTALVPIVSSILMLMGVVYLFPYVWEMRAYYAHLDLPGLPVTAAIKSAPLLLAMACVGLACILHLFEDVSRLRLLTRR